MGVPSAVEHIVNETTVHARTQASNRMAWSKSEGKGKIKENKRKSKGKSKGTKSANQRLTQGQNIENWSLRSSKLEIGGKLGHSGICTDMYR